MSDNDLGAWSEERAALENVRLTGRGNDAGAPDDLRFGRSVLQLVTRRERQPGCEFDRPAAFVLVPRDWQRPAGAMRRPLLHSGQVPLCGQVHFVNVVANGYSLSYEGDDCALMDALSHCNAGSLPTLIYCPNPTGSTLSWFPHGTHAETHLELWSVNEPTPDVKRVFEAIDRTYFGELVTPANTEKDLHLWEDAGKGRAKENAEARVQHSIRLTLLGAFRNCSVRSEQADKDGRTDLELVEDRDREAHEVVHHAVMELKVLREFGSTGAKYTDKAISQHMRDGLEQADQYGKRRNFRERMLCCFDMRAKNIGPEVAFADLTVDAQKLGVELGYWFLYRSPNDWRKDSVARSLGA